MYAGSGFRIFLAKDVHTVDAEEIKAAATASLFSSDAGEYSHFCPHFTEVEPKES